MDIKNKIKIICDIFAKKNCISTYKLQDNDVIKNVYNLVKGLEHHEPITINEHYFFGNYY